MKNPRGGLFIWEGAAGSDSALQKCAEGLGVGKFPEGGGDGAAILIRAAAKAAIHRQITVFHLSSHHAAAVGLAAIAAEKFFLIHGLPP